jgi:H+-translocating NAD(P) transhydrogenase
MLDMFKRPGDAPEHNYLYFLPALALLTIYSAGLYYGAPAIASMTYLASAAASIAAIGCLSNQKTARIGNALGMMGVAGGISATAGLLAPSQAVALQLIGSLGVGLGLGGLIAKQLKITELPEMVAAFHSLVCSLFSVCVQVSVCVCVCVRACVRLPPKTATTAATASTVAASAVAFLAVW